MENQPELQICRLPSGRIAGYDPAPLFDLMDRARGGMDVREFMAIRNLPDLMSHIAVVEMVQPEEWESRSIFHDDDPPRLKSRKDMQTGITQNRLEELGWPEQDMREFAEFLDRLPQRNHRCAMLRRVILLQQTLKDGIDEEQFMAAMERLHESVVYILECLMQGFIDAARSEMTHTWKYVGLSFAFNHSLCCAFQHLLVSANQELMNDQRELAQTRLITLRRKLANTRMKSMGRPTQYRSADPFSSSRDSQYAHIIGKVIPPPEDKYLPKETIDQMVENTPCLYGGE